MSLSVLLLYLQLFFIAFAVVQSVKYVAVSTLSLLGIFLVGSSLRELGRTNRRVCTLSWNHSQKGRQKAYLVWCGYPLSNLTALVFSKLHLPFLTIMRPVARNGSKGFFKCSVVAFSWEVFFYYYNKGCCSLRFQFKEFKGKWKEYCFTYDTFVLSVLDGGTKLRHTVLESSTTLDRPTTNHSDSG